MEPKITCVKVSGTKPEIDKIIKELNPFLTKLVSKNGTALNTVMDYPNSILFKFDDPNDAGSASIKISSMFSDYDENARRTKNGAEKNWTNSEGKTILTMVVMPEGLGYERNWKI